MPGNAGKKMGMMQLGLLTVAALLLAGALVVKTKRDAVADDVPLAIAQEMAQQAPAGHRDNTEPRRSFGKPGASGGSAGTEADADEAVETPPAMQEADCSAYQGWIGKKLDRAAVEATGKPHRILKPGDAMTMDFNPERINVETDEKGKMETRVFCG